MMAINYRTVETIILIGHQALYLGHRQKYSLLCTNQMQKHGIRFAECSVHLRTDSKCTYSIIVEEDALVTLLDLEGVICYF